MGERAGSDLGGAGVVARQVDVEVRAAADLAGAFDPALVLLDDAEHHRQSQAGALARPLGGEEGVEDARADVGRDALAGVGDAQADELARPSFEMLLDERLVEHGVGGFQPQHAALRHGVAGVQAQVHEHLV